MAYINSNAVTISPQAPTAVIFVGVSDKLLNIALNHVSGGWHKVSQK